MKIYISADIEGINGICHWDEANSSMTNFYSPFQKQMTKEVAAACEGAKLANAKKIFIKDAHSSARNLIIEDLPDDVILHRGWSRDICSMMAKLDNSYDAVLFIGYHSPCKSDKNTLAHTMNTRIEHIKINGEIVSEFTLNSWYAAYHKVPIAFLSGDSGLTEIVKKANPNIETVATKEDDHGACFSKHPNITNKEITTAVKKALSKDLSNNFVSLPKNFDIEIQYRTHAEAYSNSFFPNASLKDTDKIIFSSNNYYDVLVFLKFVL